MLISLPSTSCLLAPCCFLALSSPLPSSLLSSLLGKCREIIIIIRWIFFFLFIDRELTTWPANKCFAANNILLMRNWNYALVWKWWIGSPSRQRVPWFDIFSWSKEWCSNDKTIIELGFRKISWFVSVSQFNCLPQPSASANNWSARHWQKTICCPTSSNC